MSDTDRPVAPDDAEALAAAQAQLERNRATLDAEAPQDLRTIFELLAMRLGLPAMPEGRGERPTCTACAALWAIGRPPPCGTCAARKLVPPDELELRRRMRRAVPERYRDATWQNPELPRRVHGGLEAMRRAWQALRTAKRVTIVGPAGAGKSTIAAAHVLERLAAGVERARFIACPTLGTAEVPEGGPTPMALALSADVLVLDDLGRELEGAPPGSGLLAQRIGPAMRLIGDRYDRQRGWVVTTALEVDDVAKFYGDAIARRLFEGAEGTCVIRLGAQRGDSA
jgi:hypothetical protein